MKKLYLVILINILFICSGYSGKIIDISVSYQPSVDKLESLFKSVMPINKGVVYTKVPRGLIISFNKGIFFSEGDARVKESSLYILDSIAEELKKLPNYCVIEDHTFDNNLENSYYKENWELSMARSANIADYMVLCRKLPAERLFSLGFGQNMPFSTGVDSRVDFVILEYEAMR